MRVAAVVCAAVLAGCSSSKAASPHSTAPTPAADPAASGSTGAPASGATGSTGKPHAQSVSHPMAAQPGTMGAGATSAGAAAAAGMADAASMATLKPGETRLALAGCATEATEEGGARFPQKPVMRGPGGGNSITFVPSATGVLITHELSHACCLKASVESKVDAGLVAVTEKLTGNACRCMCSSTLKTSVGLAPGSYTLVVQTAHGSRYEEVLREALVVK